MANLNKTLIIGNVGKPVELRYTPSGMAVGNFTVAVNSFYTKSDGEKQQDTEWFNVVVWGKLAEVCNQYLTKGKQVFVEGQMKTRSWDDKEGTKHYKTELHARQVQFLGSKPTEGVETVLPKEIEGDEVEPEDLPF